MQIPTRERSSLCLCAKAAKAILCMGCDNPAPDSLARAHRAGFLVARFPLRRRFEERMRPRLVLDLRLDRTVAVRPPTTRSARRDALATPRVAAFQESDNKLEKSTLQARYFILDSDVSDFSQKVNKIIKMKMSICTTMLHFILNRLLSSSFRKIENRCVKIEWVSLFFYV